MADLKQDPYENIAPQHRIQLPKVLAAQDFPKRYPDSSHQLWRLETTAGARFLKVCDAAHIHQARFWQGIQTLFGLDLSAALDAFPTMYAQIADDTPLQIPKLYAAASADDAGAGFLMTDVVAGDTAEKTDVDSAMVETLAAHIAALHQQQQDTWGAYHAATKPAASWGQDLAALLQALAIADETATQPIVHAAIKQAGVIETADFVPMMTDLRWDQFLQQNGQITAMVDLDAFIFAPRALDFVLLEYILDAPQAAIFTAAYNKVHTVPDLTAVRTPYRLLLHGLRVLGVVPLAEWLAQPLIFQ